MTTMVVVVMVTGSNLSAVACVILKGCNGRVAGRCSQENNDMVLLLLHLLLGMKTKEVRV